jgi:hypothetical protein
MLMLMLVRVPLDPIAGTLRGSAVAIEIAVDQGALGCAIARRRKCALARSRRLWNVT